MTNQEEPKQKRLTFGAAKLSLNRSQGQTNITRSAVNSAKTIVEVKKSSSQGGVSFHKVFRNHNSVEDVSSNASEEFNRRLAILKNAVEEKARLENTDKVMRKIGDISRVNTIVVEEELEETKLNINDLQTENTFSDNDAVLNSVNSKIDDKNITSYPKGLKSNLVKTLQNNRSISLDNNLEKEKNLDTKVIAPKVKTIDSKRLKKSDILNMLDSDDNESRTKSRSLASIKRARDKVKRKAEQHELPEKIYREVVLHEVISVFDLANKMSERVADVIKELMNLGIVATSNQIIDSDVAELVAQTLGHTVKKVQSADVENVLIDCNNNDVELHTRAPVVTVMGHVDHGKTSLLDALKATDVVSKEKGGITQNIGASRITLSNGKSITFIDTPGHEAFSEMRIRGAKVTDIVVLVVAADDGIKPQTVEAINHAKAANVPIIVAINKIDKVDINIEKVKNELLVYELVAEELGGDTIIVPVSALKKINLQKLEDAILLIAEMQDLKANYKGLTSGVVLEGSISTGIGPAATVLVQHGVLYHGDIIVAGIRYGKIKRIKDDKGNDLIKAEPSFPVEVYGFDDIPRAGDTFHVINTEKQARDIIEYRKKLAQEKKISLNQKSSIEELFLKANGIKMSIKELSIILKCDSQGTIEAIIASLQKLQTEKLKIKILHYAVGNVLESDAILAKASNAIIIAFNVKVNNNAIVSIEKNNLKIKFYSVIYNLLNDIEFIMNDMLDPIFREQHIGNAEIRQVFNISKTGKIAGSYVTKGIIKKGSGVRIIRNEKIIYEGRIKTLKRFKEDVKEVRENSECGILFEKYDDINELDKIEVFEMIEEKR